MSQRGRLEQNKKLYSLVFSFRNEADNIPELVSRVSAVMEGIQTSNNDSSYEMIFVDDNSTDNSVELLKMLASQFPISVIQMSRRFGVAPCVLAGLAYAKGDAVIYMDSDLQDPPELIPQMIDLFLKGAEVVHTTRTHRDGEGWLKIWLTNRAYSIINYFSEIELPKNTGDFKLLSRRAVDEIQKMPEMDPYIRGLSVWVGFHQEFVYYRRDARFKGTTKFPLFGPGPIREFIRGLTAFSAAPLYVSFLFGIAASMFSVLLIIYAVISKLANVSAPGVSGVLIAVSFFSGIILVTNGAIGLYVARIYNEVKRRPKYIVKNVITRNLQTKVQ